MILVNVYDLTWACFVRLSNNLPLRIWWRLNSCSLQFGWDFWTRSSGFCFRKPVTTHDSRMLGRTRNCQGFCSWTNENWIITLISCKALKSAAESVLAFIVFQYFKIILKSDVIKNHECCGPNEATDFSSLATLKL